ncbi:MAG: transporter substrate-binding domain-containing protein [Comamonadaceae bacterium]|nr:MAG: transporter substrate-binding domain-containing protein [Comamonadaceae bacterium]
MAGKPVTKGGKIVVSRRSFTAATVLAAVSLGVPALRAQSKIEKPRVSIAVGGKAALYYLPLTVAEQLGFFKAEGVDVEITDFPGGSRAVQALTGGTVDVCAGAFEHTIYLQAQNRMFRAFVLQGRAPQIAFGVSTRAMANYKTVADLKGRRIGVSDPGSSTNMLASLVLSRGGLKDSDVSFIGVGTTAGALTALRTGQIDAISNTDPVMTMLEQKGDVRIISDTRTLKGTTEIFGGSMPAACLFAAQEFVQKNPNTVQGMANAIVHALKWLQTAGPGDLIKAVPESYFLEDRAVYLASFNKVRESICIDGLIPEDGPRTALRALASFDQTIKPDRIELSKTFTNEFSRRAKERFKA